MAMSFSLAMAIFVRWHCLRELKFMALSMSSTKWWNIIYYPSSKERRYLRYLKVITNDFLRHDLMLSLRSGAAVYKYGGHVYAYGDITE
jgi:hypothetical protein